ncbi:hypothetical protein C8Q78DRAFT_1036014 [Trametes maxima]|nr:hypothetical protein C8Q78DRAFT_1036014 [Trametes maxima]
MSSHPDSHTYIFPSPPNLPNTLYVRGSLKPKSTLQAMIGLENDLMTFTYYLRQMYRSADGHLVPGPLLSKQAPEDVDKYIKNVLKNIPSFDWYEDAWPAICYARYWCKLRRASVGRQGEEASVGHTRAAAPPTPGRRWRMTSVTITSRPTPSVAQARSSEREGSFRTANSSASDNGPALHLQSGSTVSVQKFLRSLTQPLECLLPTLAEIGVQDGESLLGLARMVDRYEWLEKKLVMGRARITPLQLKHLEDGLTELLKKQKNVG